MADFQITLITEGLSDDDGDVRLAAFLNQINKLNSLLVHFDRAASGGKRSLSYRIKHLSHSSPLEIGIEPYSIKPGVDHRGTVIESLNTTFKRLEAGEILDETETDILLDIKELASQVGKSVANATLKADGRIHDLTPETVHQVDRNLIPGEQCFGFIEGALEQINIHRGANIFNIYPAVGPTKVRCHFPNKLLDDAVAGLGRQVGVTGLLKYRPRQHFPSEIEADEIEIYPLEDELPTFSDVRGFAPDATGERLSEDFIADLRDGWPE